MLNDWLTRWLISQLIGLLVGGIIDLFFSVHWVKWVSRYLNSLLPINKIFVKLSSNIHVQDMSQHTDVRLEILLPHIFFTTVLFYVDKISQRIKNIHLTKLHNIFKQDFFYEYGPSVSKCEAVVTILDIRSCQEF